MASFKIYKGSYVEVIKGLGLPSGFYATNGSKIAYDDQIEKDLDRICYLNLHGDTVGMQARLVDTTGLPESDMSYTQGNFYGGVFTQCSIQQQPIFHKTAQTAAEDQTLENYYKSIGFTYVDDEGVQCGFSISYVRDDSDRSIPVEQRKYPFTIAIIKNVTKAPSEREVTYIAQNALVPELDLNNLEGAEVNRKIQTDLESGAVMKEIRQALNSKSIEPLIPEIIKDDSIALVPFLKLHDRLIVNKNLDDRDPKLHKLFDLFLMWARLAADQTQSYEKSKLMQKLMNTVNLAYQDVNYFQNKSLNVVEAMIKEYEENPLILILPPINNAEMVKQSLMNVVNNYHIVSAAILAQLNKDLEAYASKNGFSDSEEMQAKIKDCHSHMKQKNGGTASLM